VDIGGTSGWQVCLGFYIFGNALILETLSMKLYKAFLLSLLLLMSFVGQAQLVIEVTDYPPISPESEGLFLATDFNGWNPGNRDFLLKKRPDGVYTITLPDTLPRFEYKFTQGSWMTVEGTARGTSISNRVYERGSNPTPNRITVAIRGWEQNPGYQFVITEVPANTPHDAKLFLTGNFNKWDPGDENLELKKQADGTYRVTLYTDLDRIEYKFTRGNWESVEGRESGKARHNRVLFRHENIDNKAIEQKIESWEDLTGTFHFYSIYDLLLLFSAFQGLLLLIFIPTIQNYNRSANRLLVILIAVSSLMILLRVVSSFRDVAQTYTKLLLVPDFIYFTYGPLFYMYIRRLLFSPTGPVFRWPVHFALAAVQLLFYLPYFFMQGKEFQLKIVNQDWDVTALFLGSGLTGLLVNGFYWFRCRRTLREYRNRFQSSHSYEQNLEYLNTVQAIQAVCLVLWLFTFVLLGLGELFSFSVIPLLRNSVDLIWLAFSSIVYFLGYFAIHQPEIFKMPQPEAGPLFDAVPTPLPARLEAPARVELRPQAEPRVDLLAEETAVVPAPAPKPVRSEPDPMPEEDLQPLVQQVEAYMRRYKPYTNPSLTIHELAAKLKMQPHLLSKVINLGFDRNFFDFINSYRVEELKKRLEDPQYKNYSLLSLAFDVGFNSKTAFNRAFKKITQQTPSEYFQTTRDAV